MRTSFCGAILSNPSRRRSQGMTVNCADFLTVPRVAVIVVVVVELTFEVLNERLAVVAPAKIVTDFGTTAAD